MGWVVEVVTLLALGQYILFAVLVGKARERYGVQAPAVTGHAMFERYYRVQMNTLELLVVFLPSLWLAGKHWPAYPVAAVGFIYLLGRQVYMWAYVRDPASRSLGYALSALPVLGLLVAALVGAVRVALI